MAGEVEMEYEEFMEASSSGSVPSAPQEERDAHLAKKESADVSKWRHAVVLMLAITSGVVLAFTYNFMSRAEEEEFRASVSTAAKATILSPLFSNVCIFRSSNKALAQLLPPQNSMHST